MLYLRSTEFLGLCLRKQRARTLIYVITMRCVRIILFCAYLLTLDPIGLRAQCHTSHMHALVHERTIYVHALNYSLHGAHVQAHSADSKVHFMAYT